MLISSKLEQEEKFTVAIITDISKKLDKKTKQFLEPRRDKVILLLDDMSSCL